MVVAIDLRATPATVALVEPDDFRTFKVVARGEDRERLGHAVQRVGRTTGDDHVFVAAEALRRLAGERAGASEWLASLDGMLEYARAHGWTDEAGAIRAHVQWTV